MKKNFGTLNPFEVSSNSVFKRFCSENYLSSYSTIRVIFVHYQKFYFEKCPENEAWRQVPDFFLFLKKLYME